MEFLILPNNSLKQFFQSLVYQTLPHSEVIIFIYIFLAFDKLVAKQI